MTDSPAASLARYAARSDHTRGRRYIEPPPNNRTEFQRDRDRIVHSTAFRRLEYKTQVFVNHEGDLFRTRLTHSIEVAQIARSIARQLRLNEDLVEAIALAHDLGHTPFGHAGQDALNRCMREHGGFEHNLQSLRVVDLLEQRYASFDGLNLCFETREGVLKHCSPARAPELGELGLRFLRRGQPSLEAQLANLADEIAYDNHDIDDGLRSGLLSLDALERIDLFAEHAAPVRANWPDLPERRFAAETIRRIVNAMVQDLIIESTRRIDAAQPADIDAVRASPPLIAFSGPMRQRMDQLNRFLRANLYRNARVQKMTDAAARLVGELFDAYLTDADRLPSGYRNAGNATAPRSVADYIAGMTDRFAIKEHSRLGFAPLF